MKCTQVLAFFLVLIDAVQCTPHMAAIAKHIVGVKKPSPVGRIVDLLDELKTSIEGEGAAEQKAYDEHACWCEATTKRKAADINTAEETIVKLQASILKFNAEVAAHETEITNLKKSIKENFESQSEATELRAKENAEFEKSKTEFESCIGAVSAASKVLDGTGTGKTKFLETLQEAQMLGVLQGMRKVMKSSVTTKSLSMDDFDMMNRFVKKPEEFVGNRLSGFSATQISQNPFGDYAPRSTRIQGILKELAATFAADLQTAVDEEAAAVKEFESLMATKAMEAKTLQETLDITEFSSSSKSEQVAQDRTALDDTKTQLDADEAFFAETKEACKTKAQEWSERSRIRMEELHGISQAINVLTTPEAMETFNSSSYNFLQVHSQNEGNRRQKAYVALKKLSMKFPTLALAQIAAAVNTGGHFDKVIVMIDEMMKTLRAEEAEDITHRDLCQGKENANSNEIDDLTSDISKTDQAIGRMTTSIEGLNTEIEALEGQVEQSKKDLEALLGARNEAVSEFKTNLKDDMDAVALLEKAIVYLTQVYTNNKLELGLMQKKAPEYAEDPDKAPKTWSSPYTGRSSETGGIISILSLVKEDIENEIKTDRSDDAAAEAEYEKMRASLQEGLDAQEALLIAKEKAKSMLEGEKGDATEFKGSKEKDLENEEGVKSALNIDCKWVSETFASRREKRKMEMDGLVEAKAFLSGIDAGAPVIPTL